MAFFGKKREKRALDHRIGAYFLGLQAGDPNIRRMSSVLAAVNVLCQDLARVPLDLYERRDDGGRVKATGHPVQSLLKRPNPAQTSYRFFYLLWSSAIWWGNGYALIHRAANITTELRVIDPSRVTVAWKDGQLVYTVAQDGGGSRTHPASEIIHIPGYGYDGRQGYPLTDYLLHVATMQERITGFLSGYFQSGASPGVVVKLPFDPTEEEAEQIKAKFEQFRGSHNWFNLAVLPRDWDLERLTIQLDEQKLLALLTFTVEEIARLLRLPLWKLGIYQNLNYNSLEMMSSLYVADSVSPWMTSLVEELEAKLVPAGRYYIEPNYNALLQTDTEARYRAYATALQWGFMTHNEIRGRENLPSYGDFGDKVMVPANMIVYKPGKETDTEPAPQPLDPSPPSASSRPAARGLFLRRSRRDVIEAARIKQRVALSSRRQYEAELRRLLRRETNDIIQKMEKIGVSNELYGWYLNDYQPTHREYVLTGLRDVMTAEAEAVQALVAAEVQGFAGMTPRVQDCVDVHAERVADRLLKRNASALHGLVLDGIELERVKELVREWVDEVAPQLAAWESIRVAGLVSKAEYHYHGLPFQWVHLDQLAPCELLDGKVLQPAYRCEGNPFLSATSVLRLKDGRDFKPGWNVTTPPITEGCTCQIMAVFD